MFVKATVIVAAMSATATGLFFAEDRYNQTELKEQIIQVSSNTHNYLLDLRIEQKQQMLLQYEAVKAARPLTSLEKHIKRDAGKSLKRLKDIKEKQKVR